MVCLPSPNRRFSNSLAIVDFPDGALQQVAPPMQLYRKPQNQFVASFIGSPSMNFVRGAIERENGRPRFVAPGLAIPVPESAANLRGPIVLGVRPHDIALGGTSDGAARGVVSLVEPLGSEQIVYVSVPGGHDFVAAVGPESAPRVDDTVALRIAPNAIHLFDPQTGARVALGD